MFDLSLVITVLLLGLASALSPGLLAITLAFLSSKHHQKSKAIAFLFGGIVTAVLLLFVGMNIDDLSDGLFQFFQPTGTGTLVLGALMVIFGVYSLIQKNDPVKTNLSSKPEYFKIALFGFIVNITNLDAVLLNFTAIREIDNAHLSLIPETILVLIADFFFVSPVLIPLLIYMFYPEKSKILLEPIGDYMRKYGKYLVAAIFIGFGLLLLSRAGILHF